MSRLIDVPGDAGAFVAMGVAARDAVVRLRAPSIVGAIGVGGVAAVSVPVERASRPSGTSAWRSSSRLRQSAATLRWVAQQRPQRSYRMTTGEDLCRAPAGEGH